MINSLRFGKTANFQRLKRRLSNAAIDQLFRQVRLSQPSASQNLFHHRRVRAGDAHWSAISFLYERTPAFLLEDVRVRERVCGFLLLVEYREHIAIFKSRLDLPARFATRYLGRVAIERVDAAVARADSVFEKIRLHNMSLSKLAMRNKTLEADDLRNVVGPAGSSRYAPQAYSVRSGPDHYSATLSTGRIAQRSDRVDHLTLIDYAVVIIDDLVDREGAPSEFIGIFARGIDLNSIEGVARPTSFAIDVARLADAVHERGEIRFVREDGPGYVELTEPEIGAVLAELHTILEVRGEGKLLDLIEPDEDVRVGAIAINKTRIALRDLQLPLITELEVESTSHPLGEDPDRMILRRYLDRQDAFLLLFDQLSLAYIDGTLFRDGSLVDGGAELLRHLRTDPLLADVTSEKGEFGPDQTAFDRTSTFGVVIASVADGDEVLVCDDLGDEWADFVGLNNSSSPPRITFYHAKHGDLSLGAEPFHVSISQAIKNLQRLSLPVDAMPGKLRGWRRDYVSGRGVHTSISRVVRETENDLGLEFEQAGRAPDVIRRVFIVTSSLSRRAVEQVLADIAGGQSPDPYFVQLYQLLLSFFSACTDMNAFGYVVCRE